MLIPEDNCAYDQDEITSDSDDEAMEIERWVVRAGNELMSFERCTV